MVRKSSSIRATFCRATFRSLLGLATGLDRPANIGLFFGTQRFAPLSPLYQLPCAVEVDRLLRLVRRCFPGCLGRSRLCRSSRLCRRSRANACRAAVTRPAVHGADASRSRPKSDDTHEKAANTRPADTWAGARRLVCWFVHACSLRCVEVCWLEPLLGQKRTQYSPPKRIIPIPHQTSA